MVGPYRIVATLGEGGMGVVYLAEQDSPVRRRVALKLIQHGQESREVVARFQSERQALALLNHPNIAQMFDAGTTEDGRPYFVMEYISGVPLTRYAAEERLTVRGRLNLFLQVCDGVQHAHQKGLIHRDLKPSNVLVTAPEGKPTPKIIDFGVAKATAARLTEASMHTTVGRLIGTPLYMSPEQAGGNVFDLDTRSDVYALGVMLYELLVGTRPVEPGSNGAESYGSFLRRVCEEEPRRPSARLSLLDDHGTDISTSLQTDPGTLRRVLRGDLDWIIMRCLEKDRARRYPSVSELRDDIRRHLEHEPVLAGPPGGIYRTQKFLRRHRVAVIAAALVSIAVILGIIGTGVGLIRALAAERQQRQEAETARQVSDFLVGLFQVSDPGEARGRTVTAREILDDGAARIETELRNQPAVQARLLGTMGSVYAGLGMFDRAEAMLRESLGVLRATHGEKSAEVASGLLDLGNVYIRAGHFRDAEPLLRRALAIRREVLSPEDAATGYSLYWLSVALSGQGKFPETRQLLTEAQGIFRRSLGPEHTAVAWCLNDLALISDDLGDHAAALPLFQEAARIKEKNLGSDHPDVILGWNNVAGVLTKLGRFSEARAILDRNIPLAERVFGPDHPSTAHLYQTRGILYSRLHELALARNDLEHAVSICERSHAPDYYVYAFSLTALAGVDVERGTYSLAEGEYRKAMALHARSNSANSLDAAECLEGYAALLEREGRKEEARAAADRAAEIRRAAGQR